MRAVRLKGQRRATLDDLAPPVAASGESLVTVRAAAICATDRKAFASGRFASRTLGHEFAGERPDGTPVAVHPEVSCGLCAACRVGLENRCPARVSIGLGRDGGFAETAVVPDDRLLELDGVPMGLAPLLEPLACCIHALELLEPRDGDTGLVVGAGVMGVLSMWAMQASGMRVAVLQRSEPRRSLASSLGADAVVADGQDPAAALGAPPRVAIVSAPGGPPLDAALELVAVGGAVHVLASSPGGAPADANLVHYRHLSLVGSTGSTFATYRRARQLVAAGRVPLERLPVERIGLEDVPAALARPVSGTRLKTLVDI